MRVTKAPAANCPSQQVHEPLFRELVLRELSEV
jgi:hypothetical protein